jgi:hypothetical protein
MYAVYSVFFLKLKDKLMHLLWAEIQYISTGHLEIGSPFERGKTAY